MKQIKRLLNTLSKEELNILVHEFGIIVHQNATRTQLIDSILHGNLKGGTKRDRTTFETPLSTQRAPSDKSALNISLDDELTDREKARLLRLKKFAPSSFESDYRKLKRTKTDNKFDQVLNLFDKVSI